MKKNKVIEKYWGVLITVIILIAAAYILLSSYNKYNCSENGIFYLKTLDCTNAASCITKYSSDSCDDIALPTDDCIDYTRGIGCTNQVCTAWVYKVAVC
jgi:hypothetical protein